MTGGPPAFPWEEAFAFALGPLRLTPDTFWSLTPREFACLVRAARPAPLRADDLRRLLAAHPDTDPETRS